MADDDGPPRAWAAPVGAVVLGLAAALGLGAWAVAASDPPGRLLVGVAAVALACAALVGAIARPRLRADDEGLVLRGATGARAWPWERVDAVRVVRLRRMGLPAAYVEIDARDEDEPGGDEGADGAPGRERLLVLGRLELGTDPVEVVEALQHHRAAAGRRRAGSGSGEQQDPRDDQHEQDPGDDPGEGEARGRP